MNSRKAQPFDFVVVAEGEGLEGLGVRRRIVGGGSTSRRLVLFKIES